MAARCIVKFWSKENSYRFWSTDEQLADQCLLACVFLFLQYLWNHSRIEQHLSATNEPFCLDWYRWSFSSLHYIYAHRNQVCIVVWWVAFISSLWETAFFYLFIYFLPERNDLIKSCIMYVWDCNCMNVFGVFQRSVVNYRWRLAYVMLTHLKKKKRKIPYAFQYLKYLFFCIVFLSL